MYPDDVFNHALLHAHLGFLESADASAGPRDEGELGALAQFVAGQDAHIGEDTLIICRPEQHLL